MFCYWLVLFINYSAGRGRKEDIQGFRRHPGAQKFVPEKKSGAALPDFPVWPPTPSSPGPDQAIN
jgi:hypothetical protein